ncbi:DUF6961 family protein [Sphingomonas solaris]|uniref:Uncharacterized protein n=1 Tax=Alterirhizorhabdus solaris TaxID=2529389 RepID=A0A558QW86_9SPHN|nr:hypothetical protein [Sphingomonas solaris]TVV71379.1 hypothetical protein FOY91_16930 [Sphingomonas solaris]
MLAERALWACANNVLMTHGGQAPAFADGRIAALTEAGDDAGVTVWRMIADRIGSLRDTAGDGGARH